VSSSSGVRAQATSETIIKRQALQGFIECSYSGGMVLQPHTGVEGFNTSLRSRPGGHDLRALFGCPNTGADLTGLRNNSKLRPIPQYAQAA
jgi:hypothetical protein